MSASQPLTPPCPGRTEKGGKREKTDPRPGQNPHHYPRPLPGTRLMEGGTHSQALWWLPGRGLPPTLTFREIRSRHPPPQQSLHPLAGATVTFE